MPVWPLEHRYSGVQFERTFRVVPEVREFEFRDADFQGPEFLLLPLAEIFSTAGLKPGF